MTASAAVRAGAEGPGTGLAVLRNKGEIAIGRAAPWLARLRNMRRRVTATAKTIHNGLLDAGYSHWYQRRSRWAYAAEHEFRTAMLTLTYRPDVDWSANQIKDLVAHYRKWAKRRKVFFAYVWVMEPHQSGRPHYHMVFWVSGGEVPPMPDTQGWWPHGRTNARWAHSPVQYIVSYASKRGYSAQAYVELPAGARLWGSGGLDKPMRVQRSYFLAPSWFKRVFPQPTEVRKRKISYRSELLPGFFADVVAVAWVAVDAMGFAALSPWEVDGFEDCGLLKLRHRGYVEVVAPTGEAFRVPQSLEF